MPKETAFGPEKQKFAGEKVPSMKRRKDGHDYHDERFYMITLAVEGRHPILGHIEYHLTEGEATKAKMHLSPLGEAVKEEWWGISKIYPQVAVVMVQMMPDHLHGILYVREHTSFHLGQVIKGFKLGCNRILRRMLAEEYAQTVIQSPHTTEGNKKTESNRETTESNKKEERGSLLQYAAISSQPPGKETLWERGYNDKILHRYSTLETWKAYLRDNPLRLAIRKAHPDYFRVRFGIRIGNNTFSAIGNRFLLSYPEKAQVQLSRSLTKEQIEEQVELFLSMARNGTVLASPAISKGEQAVMRAVLDAGFPLIFLSPWGFNSFSKPGHQYFDACAEGRFLILSPWPHHNERIPLTRQMCLELNKMTEEVCSLQKY